MNVLFTIVILAALGLWVIASYNRLIRLRNQVTRNWKALDALLKAKEPDVAHARNAYNAAVAKYNEALEVFPASLLSALGGFRAAKRFEANA